MTKREAKRRWRLANATMTCGDNQPYPLPLCLFMDEHEGIGHESDWIQTGHEDGRHALAASALLDGLDVADLP